MTRTRRSVDRLDKVGINPVTSTPEELMPSSAAEAMRWTKGLQATAASGSIDDAGSERRRGKHSAKAGLQEFHFRTLLFG